MPSDLRCIGCTSGISREIRYYTPGLKVAMASSAALMGSANGRFSGVAVTPIYTTFSLPIASSPCASQRFVSIPVAPENRLRPAGLDFERLALEAVD